MSTIKRFRPIFLSFFVLAQVYSQDPGMPFIRNYPAYEYRASQQNWAIAQDSRGIMYFGNNNGLLEYDGISWRLTKLPGVRALAIDKTGRIYTGLENDFGYLEPTRDGSYVYHSLKEKLAESDRDLTTVFRVFIIGDLTIFQTNDKLFLYQNENIKILRTSYSYHLSFVVRDRFYVREPGKGLFRLYGDSLRFIDGSERFATERIYVMLPYGSDEILIATRTQGILILSPGDGDVFKKPDNFREVNKFLDSNPVYCGTILSNGNYVLGTMTDGMIVFDSAGRIYNHYNKGNGMQDNTILWLFSDKNRQLWAAMDNGISLLQDNLPFRYYSENNGLNGTPMSMIFFKNHFYVGTGQFLHIQNSNGNFEQIAGSESQNFCFYNAGGRLLLAHYSGIFEVRDDKILPVRNNVENAFLCFSPVRNNPRYLLAGAGDGLYLLQDGTSAWELKHRLKGFNKSSYKVEQDNEGNFWTTTTVELYKLKINSTLDSIISARQYKKEQGLPSDYAFPFKLRSDEVVFCTEKGIYRYIPVKDRFEPHPDLSMLKGKVVALEQTENGDIWFDQLLENGDQEKGVLRYKNGKLTAYKNPFNKFRNMGSADSPFNICPSPDGTIFFGTGLGLLQFDPAKEFNTDRSFQTLIRSVYANDSLIFGGEHLYPAETLNLEGGSVPYSMNDLVFNFAAAFYEDSENNLYSFRLVGSDTAWSAWSSDHKKEYTNLYEGNYTFQAKSKNQYQTIGSTASYTFSVNPPWYRAWWAYGMYAIASVIVIWIIVIINIKRLVMQKKNLEQIVAERTATVVQQKEAIESNNRELNNTLELVSSQKRVIETAHEEITASINYAKFIQSSVLPKDEELEAYLGDYFVMHKPVEIVSGDFYWISSAEGKVIVAAADCTGHGVPGAFMSMLGIALLNEIVNKETITEPGIILDHLRHEVTSSLKQKGLRQEQKEGMDISVCTIDRKNMKLKFAGANNPLYLIRKHNVENVGIIHPETKGEMTLIEIKGDQMPIGLAEDMQSFSSHEIDILKDDLFYMFTDGFPDQFGGSAHKKFSYKRFRELLLGTITDKVSGQKPELEDALGKWIGNENQTDDILVIGFRIS
jgi:serine phosphatase RsbU (regulator of sigma subunit)